MHGHGQLKGGGKISVLHWLPDPYCKDNMKVIILQGANIDPQKKTVLISKVKAGHVTLFIYFPLPGLSPTAGQ